MKRLILPLAVSLIAHAAAADVPKIFEGLFEKDIPVRGQMGVVMPPEEIEKYLVKVNEAARQDPVWFREQSAKSKPGTPLPYDPKLGLTQDEYNHYLELWAKREFKPLADVVLILRQASPTHWTLMGLGGPEGAAEVISTLRYSPEADTFHSPNGTMTRLEDINADSESILGAWSGKEWKFEESTTLARTKENFAIGQFADKKHGIVVYRLQEIATEGGRPQDKSVVIRFLLGKEGRMNPSEKRGQTKPAAPKAKAPAKTAPKDN
jgi:hypothetical protein